MTDAPTMWGQQPPPPPWQPHGQPHRQGRRPENGLLQTVISAAVLVPVIALAIGIPPLQWEQQFGAWPSFAIGLIPDAVFVLVLLIRGRGIGPRLLATAIGAVAFAASAVMPLAVALMSEDIIDTWGPSEFETVGKSCTYATYFLAALAWGVGRRRGALWLVALPLTPALTWLALRDETHRWLTDIETPPSGSYFALTAAMYVGVLVVGCLVCWLLDLLQRLLFSSRPGV